MSNQILQMKYHPAKKEVQFERFAGKKCIPIRDDSKLSYYMRERGKFVLQDHGNSFFEDIARAFDGEKSVHIEVITTKNDYEDLLQMIEYYNRDADVEITPTLLAELPDMEETYRVVREHGEKSISTLKKHQAMFFDVPLDNEKVKECVERFSAGVQKEVDSIREKIESMSDNSVNLCFAGVYSAGKSALINAILGYKILPEDIKSETAKMFKIQSPKKGEPVHISFSIGRSRAKLIWNDKSGIFEFDTDLTENNTRKAIQETLNLYKGQGCHLQVYEVLKTLNINDEVNSDIEIFFPIPLDNDNVQFTIFDTPGTDSNYGKHRQVLQDALSEQTHSILIFVAAPDKIEGEGNSSLLSYLKNAESKGGKTTIDIDRSLFVINKADTIDPDARKVLQTAKITDTSDDRFSIKLSDKKLFFVSAMYAYSAKAVANKIDTADERFRIEDDYNKIFRPERGRYYKQNRVATSERATGLQISLCDEILSKMEHEDDKTGIFVLCSGLFALETEIIAYGEKYAAAVRAFAIIDSVDKALSAIKKNTQSLESRSQTDLHKIEEDIATLERTISKSIKQAREKHDYPENTPLPTEVLELLCLNSEYLQTNVIGKVLDYVNESLKGWFFGAGKVQYDEKDKEKIIQKIEAVLSDFTEGFLEKRQQHLEKKRDEFIKDIQTAIIEDENLSEEAKNYVLEISQPTIDKAADIAEFGEMYDNRKRVDKFLWMEKPHIDKDGFIEEAERKLTEIATSMATDFEKDFRSTLDSVLSAIETEFAGNIEKYSVIMQARHADKKAMEQLHDKITKAAGELKSCQDDLNKVIWSVKENG